MKTRVLLLGAPGLVVVRVKIPAPPPLRGCLQAFQVLLREKPVARGEEVRFFCSFCSSWRFLLFCSRQSRPSGRATLGVLREGERHSSEAQSRERKGQDTYECRAIMS